MTATLPMSEQQLQAAVLELARLLGYLAYHTFDSRKSEPGFPDLVLATQSGAPRVIFAELKADRGKLSPEQERWARALYPAWVCWRPADWVSGEIEQVLRGDQKPKREGAA